MRRWLPRVGRLRASTTDPFDPEMPDYEGFAIVVCWLGFTIDLTLARRRS